MAKGIHTEESFEALIERHLVEEGGYEAVSPGLYKPDLALIPDVLVDFVKATQPKVWKKLLQIRGPALPQLLAEYVAQVMDQRGALTILRHGFKYYGQQVKIAYFRPGHRLNPKVWELYDQNRLSVMRQVRYDPGNKDEALDLALFLNGVPIATVELKNLLTHQSVHDAIKQYKLERNPKAPIFRWKKRALVHFAVGSDQVYMTTRLNGVSTFFLPFNRGHGHGAGNPPVAGKHRTSYLWEEVWQRDSLLEIVGRFLHVQTEEGVDPNTGKPWSKETVIFPRYHQLDCVRKLVAAAREEGAGTNFLVQHSAGSGKSNSIAWLAHRLASLHDDTDRKVYDSVVVLTDRRVLDQQLQDTIYQFEHKTGVVEKIDKHSDQLAAALAGGAPVIISTIHKFGFIQDKIEALPDRRYAIIVDEAHSSQSGEMATMVKEILADSSVAERLAADEDDRSLPDQLAMRKALLRGPQPNMSFFAFTATPKFKTLEMFGHLGPDGKPAPFHLYSMRQAIEEGFILDVLRGYTTYDRFFALAKAVADDPALDKRKASAALARFVNLHPSNIAQKVEIIVEHFRECVKPLLKGRAKAMIVTGSRLQAVKYKQQFDKYVGDKGYDDVRALVAFSGEVEDDEVPGVRYTEPGMNQGIRESELPDKFASDAYQVLIVANKYQTGFDQPLLVAMYVDKRLAGVQAVQTLSRLNRQASGKEQTFVLDFVNKRKEILNAFQPYYEDTTVKERVSPQRLYELQHKLDGFQLYTPSELDGFAKVFFAMRPDQDVTGNAKLNAWLDPAVDRFKALGDEAQADFRKKLQSFKSLYSFLGQIIPFQDVDLEKLYAFGRMLLRKLPRPDTAGPLELDDDVALVSLKLKKASEGDIALAKSTTGQLKGPTGTGSGHGHGSLEKLSTIIELVNERFGTTFDSQDLVDGVTRQLLSDAGLQQAAKVNDKGNFKVPFDEALDDALVERHTKDGDFINKVFSDEALGEFFRTVMLDRIYGELKAARDMSRNTSPAEVLPFRRVPIEEADPFVNCIPALDLKVAAGGFSPDQIVDEDPRHYDWVQVDGVKPSKDLFVAQVVGESMNRRIPNGAWCVWRLDPEAPEGKVVLAQHRDIQDPETDGRYTVKLYEKQTDSRGRAEAVVLRAQSSNHGFEDLRFAGADTSRLAVIAELILIL